ncbi:MAG: hypothetical protein WCC60_09615 [Ilumatobacteraceae bacterium]
MSRLALVATVALLGLAACGSDSKSTTSSTGNDAAAPATTEPAGGSDDTVVSDTMVDDTSVDDTFVDDTFVDDTFVDDTFPSDSVDPNAPGIGTEFCSVSDELNNDDFDPFSAPPDEVQAYFETDFADMFNRLKAATPDELTADVATIASLYDTLIASLRKNGWDMNAAFDDPAIQTAMSASEIDAAGANLDAYCGIS